MRKVTVQLEPEHVRMLDDLASDDGPCTTRSESVRHVVEAFDGNRDRSRSRDEERTHDDTDALRRELRSKEARITELRNHITTRDRTQRKRLSSRR
jgi:Arc/MetJ-type ribon-helix-helix transcriptional regulator